MLLTGIQEQSDIARRRHEEAMKAMQRQQATPTFGGSPMLSQRNTEAPTAPQEGGSGLGDAAGYAKQAKDAYDLYESGTGGGAGGYLAAATAFKKFVDWGFDKDATGGGLGRRNVHWLEDAWQPAKGFISDAGDIGGNVVSDIGGFFSGLF